MNEIKRTKVGCTPVTSDLTVAYYISSMDDDGREVQWGYTQDEPEARKAFEEAKPVNYDMHLYAALIKDYGSDDQELVDDEVLDTFVEEDNC